MVFTLDFKKQKPINDLSVPDFNSDTFATLIQQTITITNSPTITGSDAQLEHI